MATTLGAAITLSSIVGAPISFYSRIPQSPLCHQTPPNSSRLMVATTPDVPSSLDTNLEHLAVVWTLLLMKVATKLGKSTNL